MAGAPPLGRPVPAHGAPELSPTLLSPQCVEVTGPVLGGAPLLGGVVVAGVSSLSSPAPSNAHRVGAAVVRRRRGGVFGVSGLGLAERQSEYNRRSYERRKEELKAKMRERYRADVARGVVKDRLRPPRDAAALAARLRWDGMRALLRAEMVRELRADQDQSECDLQWEPELW